MNLTKLSSLAFLSLFWASCIIQPQPQPVAPQQGQGQGQAQVYSGQAAPQGQWGQTDWSQAVNSAPAPAPVNTAPVAAHQVDTSGIVAPVGFRNVQQKGIQVAYGPTQNFAQIKKAFQEAHVFEQIAQTMNRILVVPKVLHIHMAECGTVNAFYDPQNQRIIMCYEMVAHTFKTFSESFKDPEQVATAGVHASLFIFFHEFGHAMRHLLDLPVTGREEDAVDQFSTMLLIDAGSQDGVLMGAQFFGLESARHNDKSAQKLPFWDEHSLEQQRFYNILCLLYGSDPQTYAGLVTNNALPKPRAQRCPSEYKNIDAAWSRLLEPHLTQEARIAIQNGTQLQPQPVAQPAPIPAPTPAPQPQPQAQVSCEAVAQKALQLVFIQYQQQMGQLTPMQQQVLQQQLVQMNAQLVQQCYAESWSAASKQCVMQAQSLAQAELCN